MTFILNKYRFFLGLDRCVQYVCKDLKFFALDLYKIIGIVGKQLFP